MTTAKSEPERKRKPLDREYYRGEIAPLLPPAVLDFHTHTWAAENWKERPWASDNRIFYDTGRALLQGVRPVGHGC